MSEDEKGYTFELNENVSRSHVTYDNRYGIEISADLYTPKNMESSQKYPAIVIAGPFGAVKEQSAGLYANQLASYGYVVIAFDPSFCGESGGETRNMASPEIFTEDYSAAVDYLGLLDYVDRDKIGAIGICGLSGMAVTAAGTDTRIKAVATASMYDMSRDMSKGHQDYYTDEQRQIIRDYLSEQRWRDAESGTKALGSHEVSFDDDNNPITAPMEITEELPEGADEVTTSFFNYYAKRARNSRAVNFVTSWVATTPISFFNFPLMSNIKDVSPRPLMFIAGENAHSRYYSEDAYEAADGPKELVIVPDADHVDLYDNMDKIPFDRINTFFQDAFN
ncbi:MAG: alpha/beta hydrolase [Clostridia bacterium]|nr:alpha/beta hydrolase [Clostridia bacterium]